MLHRVALLSICSLIAILLIGQIKDTEPTLLELMSDQIEIDLSDSSRLTRLNELAATYRHSKPDSSIVIAKRVLELTDSLDYQVRLKAYKTITAAYYMTSDAKLCYNFSQELIRTAEKAGDKEAMLNGQLYLGLAFLLQDKYEEGVGVFDDYLKLAMDIKDSVSIVRAYLNRSINHQYLAHYDQALADVKRSIELARSLRNHYYEAMGHNREGYILSDLERYQEAVNSHQAALTVADSDNDWERSFAFAGLAQAFLGKGAFEKSIQYGQNAIDLAQKMAAKWDVQNASEILYKAYQAVGDYENAFKYHQLYKAYYDSIHSESNEKKIHELQLEQAQMKQEALIHENQLQQEILNQRNTQIVLTLTLVVVLLLVVGVLYYVYYTKQRYVKQLATQHKALDELNRTKNKIFSIVAHDMRSPMQTVMAMIYLIKNDRENVDIDELVDGVHKRIATVSDSLNSILEWSLTQFKEEERVPLPVDVDTIVKEQINLCNYEADQKNLKVSCHTEHCSKVLVVSEHLRIIIRNVLANAIKFNDIGGEIQIKYRDLDDQIAIDIKDTGIGMSEDQLNNLFQSRGKTRMGTQKEVGTGIGLFLCKEYAEMNRGAVTVISAEGVGTTFSVILNKANS